MVNTINNSTNSEIDSLKKHRESLSQWALQQEMGIYYAKWDFEKWDALRQFIQEKNNPSAVEQKSKVFEEKYQKMQDEIDEIRKKYEQERKNISKWTKNFIENQKEEERAVNEKMRQFFSQDMQNFVSSTNEDINELKQSKDSQIDDLKAQLSWIVTKWPKLWEYLSLKRRRLVSINDKIENLKTGEDKENYPKNVLIYLMALTNRSLFWARQWANRQGIKLTWRRKSEDIKKHLETIEDKLRVTDKDSLWTKWLKTQLQQHLLDAKQAYVEKQRQSVGLTA